MPDENVVDGNSLLLSNQQGLERFARAWILRFIGGVMFVDKSSKRVPMRYLQFLRDLRECSTYAWGAALLDNLYREMCIATDYNVKSIGGFTLLIQLWAWERCPTLVPPFIPPQQQIAPLAYRWLGGEFHHIGNDNLLELRRKLDVMKHDDGEIAETLHFMVSPVGRRVCTFEDLLPCIEKITLLFDEEDRILEAHEDAPPSQPQLEHQQFNILQRSVETRGLARHRQTVDAAPYSLPSMPERQHGMYYTPPTFTQEPSHMAPMYSYPHDFQPGYSMTGIFGSSPPLGGTLSFTQNNELSTPNAPLGGPWKVPGNIPDMDDLLGVDLRHDFSAKADEVDERAKCRRRNPDRAVRNWDRPCGTSSRHHRHSDD
ncbi:Serine/threonine-protein phosphatase 7 long form [Glycine max]|nr:Serine/threonine-protein phosphatase 7 long form [Glycine max]